MRFHKGPLYLYKINKLYKSSGILIPLILLTYFMSIPNLFIAYTQSFYQNMKLDFTV